MTAHPIAWEHNALADDLAAHLRGSTDRLVWTDMQLGPAGSPRPDVYAIPKSFAHWTPMAYEVKVTRSDFRADVTIGKWLAYRKYAAGVMFAAPVNLIEAREVPEHAGLMVRGDTGWRTLQRAVFQTLDNLPLETWIKLLLDGIERQGRINHITPQGDLVKNYLAVASEEAPELIAIRHELCGLLGIDLDSDVESIRRAAYSQMQALNRDSEVLRLKQILAAVQESLERASLPIPPLTQFKLPI